MILQNKTKAPNFKLVDQNGQEHSLQDYLGKWVLLYFYPKDMTPGCTVEACQLRDYHTALMKEGVAILGVSKDSVERHKVFATKEKLPFALLSDEDAKVIEKYGAWAEKKMFGKSYMGILRISYLIDPSGNIAKVYPKVKPATHAKEVFEDVIRFKGE